MGLRGGEENLLQKVIGGQRFVADRESFFSPEILKLRIFVWKPYENKALGELVFDPGDGEVK